MRGRRFAAFVLIAALLAGCTSTTSGTPTTGPTPTRVSSASSRPSTAHPTTSTPRTSPTVPTTGPNVRPGEKPPTLPAVARTHTRAGAAVFAAFWFQTWDWAYATTNSTLMSKYFTRSCTDCRTAAQQFVDFDREHEHFVGGRLHFQETRIVDSDHRHAAEFAVDVTEGQSALRVLDRSGHVVERDPAVKSITFRLYLRWRDGAWSIVFKAHVV